MKNIITAIVAIAISFSANAKHAHSPACPASCYTLSVITASKPSLATERIADLENKADEAKSRFQFEQSMSKTLRILEIQKQEQAMANLQAENNYNKLMNNMFSKINGEKAANEIEELEAAIRFEKLMNRLLSL